MYSVSEGLEVRVCEITGDVSRVITLYLQYTESFRPWPVSRDRFRTTSSRSLHTRTCSSGPVSPQSFGFQSGGGEWFGTRGYVLIGVDLLPHGKRLNVVTGPVVTGATLRPGLNWLGSFTYEWISKFTLESKNLSPIFSSSSFLCPTPLSQLSNL